MIVTDPVLLATVIGLKLTLITQLNPAANDGPQLLDCAKSPDAAMEEIVNAAVPELVKVTVFAALVVLIV